MRRTFFRQGLPVCVSDLSQISNFPCVLRFFFPPLKLTATIVDVTEILLKLVLNTITLTLTLKIS